MILSASGWRKVFAESGDEEDSNPSIGEENKILSALIGESFAEYIKEKLSMEHPSVVVARDTRPTGCEIAEVVLYSLNTCGVKTVFLDVASAPEIMAFARSFDGFLYISASHNPIGHNGIKFGLSDGGVIPGSEAKVLKERFESKCSSPDASDHAKELILGTTLSDLQKVYSLVGKNKKKSLKSYDEFIRHVISGEKERAGQKSIFKSLKKALKKSTLSLSCDMNGSARSVSIDKKFMPSCGINFLPFNAVPGDIRHAIIPEPENLVHCASFMDGLHRDGVKDALLGYMPDCDGDRGNIVYWNEKLSKSVPIPAQEVFALCVMSELCFEYWKNPDAKKLAVAVNCPTSMRIDEICKSLNASLFRAEVGEANVVNLAREKRSEGYEVRIFGEGSNGGNITYPSAVRDPVATVFALIKLLCIRDDGKKKGLFHIYCTLSGQENLYKNDFTLSDVLDALPSYVTTGVSEKRAVLKVKSDDKGLLKEKFGKEFIRQFDERKDELEKKFGIHSWKCMTTNGTKETVDAQEWNNGNGGLKVKFLDEKGNDVAFIWMRPSGTEPVFRIMCDVKGKNPEAEKELLSWETDIINKVDE